VLLSLILPRPRWFAIVAVALLVVAVAVGPTLAVLDVDASGARKLIQLAAGCGWQFPLLAAWGGAARARYHTDNERCFLQRDRDVRRRYPRSSNIG